MVLLTNLVLGLLDRQVLRILICKPQFMFMGVAPYRVLSVNLIFGRIVKERHEKSEQPTAQLVGTSWD